MFPLSLFSAPLLVAGLAINAPLAVAAQTPPCLGLGDMSAMLADRFQERPVFVGMSDDEQTRLMIFAAPEGRSYSVVIVGKAGAACLAGTGSAWALIGSASGADGEEG